MYLFCASRADAASEGLSLKRTDFEGFREEAAEKSGLSDGSLGEVMVEGSAGWEPWNCEKRSEYCALRRATESEWLRHTC